MLSVSFNLALVAAMLLGIVLPGNPKEVDKFNGPTREPIPTSLKELVSGSPLFKTMWTKRWEPLRTELRPRPIYADHLMTSKAAAPL
jgi:hypothetical protein